MRDPLGPAVLGAICHMCHSAPSSPNTNSSRWPSALQTTAGDPNRFGRPVGYERQRDHSPLRAVCDVL